VLYALARRENGIAPGSFHIKVDSINQFAWTIIPVFAAILVKYFWSLLDEYAQMVQPYVSLAHGPTFAQRSMCSSYQTTMVGWISIKAFIRQHYMLAAITALSLSNEFLIVGMGGETFHLCSRSGFTDT
jgi:Protein of unknown function (DUF3433)